MAFMFENLQVYQKAVDLADQHIPQGGTLAGDKGFDTADFVAELRDRRIAPHVAQNAYDTGKAKRRSNIDGRTTRHADYAASQKIRKRIEEVFGWGKEVGSMRRTKLRGKTRVEFQMLLTMVGTILAAVTAASWSMAVLTASAWPSFTYRASWSCPAAATSVKSTLNSLPARLMPAPAVYVVSASPSAISAGTSSRLPQ